MTHVDRDKGHRRCRRGTGWGAGRGNGWGRALGWKVGGRGLGFPDIHPLKHAYPVAARSMRRGILR